MVDTKLIQAVLDRVVKLDKKIEMGFKAVKKRFDQVDERIDKLGLELADKANLHYTYIGVVERGRKNISLINIEKITKALGVSLTTFFSSFK